MAAARHAEAFFAALRAAGPLGLRVLALRQTPGEAARRQAAYTLGYLLDTRPHLRALYRAWTASAAPREAIVVVGAHDAEPAVRRVRLSGDPETDFATVEAAVEHARATRPLARAEAPAPATLRTAGAR